VILRKSANEFGVNNIWWVHHSIPKQIRVVILL